MTDTLADLMIEDIGKIFEEWQRRYQDDPDGFMSDADTHAEPPKTYGEMAARYFIQLWDELAEIVP